MNPTERSDRKVFWAPLAVLALGLSLTFLAFLSSALPVHAVSDVLLWPVTLMLWVFPGPCFDRGPGEPPFCEGTPVQVLAGGFGMLLTLAFYFVVAYFLVRRFSRRWES
jgi:hypothetical protein